MNGDYIMIAALVLILIAQTIGNVMVQRNLTRSIDSLSDKIMARNYREYVGLQRDNEVDISPVTEEEEKKGWYDN